jgi:hypothetical protein
MKGSELATYTVPEVGFDKSAIVDRGRNAAHWLNRLIRRTGTLLSLASSTNHPNVDINQHHLQLEKSTRN